MLPLLVLIAHFTAGDPLPELRVTTDNTLVTRSCRIIIEPDTIIADPDGNGVIQIMADDLTVEFAEGSLLRGAGIDRSDDQLTGTGIRIHDHRNVTIRNAFVEGFHCAIHATSADKLTIEGGRITRGFRQRLRSTPQGEDQADWLWPHTNDNNQWLTDYGAAIYIEDSDAPSVHGVHVRRSQNGIILDRVRNAQIFDNDASFLSGWGLSMWRSSDNLISRNAFDFCIRGYSHGIYNRGQDSAGILLFEQCSDNQFIENSATHCGDGFFCFAGKEALGELATTPPMDFTGIGCNRNILKGNDFSFAAAHGVELTFSFDNWIVGNRLVGNAICGVWAGYSQRTVVLQNDIGMNGRASSSEGGGINIEHGFENGLSANRFHDNSIDISLWSDDDAHLLTLPWAKVNHKGSDRNIIGENTWSDAQRVVRLRKSPVTLVSEASLAALAGRTDTDAESTLVTSPVEGFSPPPAVVRSAIGDKRPVGSRSQLDGRENIFMGEWGPWDHQTPLLRLTARQGARDLYELFGDATSGGGGVAMIGLDGAGDVGTQFGDIVPGVPRALTVGTRAGIVGLRPYEFRVQSTGLDQMLRGTLISTLWSIRVFPWSDVADPRKEQEAWRKLATLPTAVAFTSDDLGGGWLRFGRGGTRDVPFLAEFRNTLPGPDHFGLIATTRLNIPAGSWKFTTLSDDGVRVLINGQPIIENWTWHGPTTDAATFKQAESSIVQITVEYFEIDGNATLDLDIQPQP